MGALTEAEIFSCMAENFRLAAECCDDLARLPKKGPTYRRFVDHLKLIEGSCRQAAHWREDARWLRVGFLMAQAHQRAGDWLRGYKDKDGKPRKWTPGEIHPMFSALAENLRKGQRSAEFLRTQRTGRIGIILPKPLPGPHRDHRPVHISRGGIILPEGCAGAA